MKLTLSLVIIFFCWVNLTTNAQQSVHFSLNQPEELMAYAGDTVMVPISFVDTLGGTPSATGGYPPYNYQWFPADYLNDNTLANPLVTGSSILKYVLTVTDSKGCEVIDTVTIDTTSVLSKIIDFETQKIFIVKQNNTTNSFTIVSTICLIDKAVVQVVDMTGKFVGKGYLMEPNEPFEITNLRAGLYVIYIYYKDTIINNKILIK